MAFSILLRRSSLSGSGSTSRWRLPSALDFIPFSASSRCSSSAPSQQQHHVENPRHSSVKTSLSARMNFVFDQIDALESDRNEKDETLQRIRAWREKKQKSEAQAQPRGPGDSVAMNSVSEAGENKENLLATKEIEVVHPWAEWVEFMEQLVRQNYFDHRRRDEDQTIRNLDGDYIPGFEEEGIDFTRDFATVRTACVNFGRDRFDILRSLSRKDIQVLVGHGCPCADSKVVISAKVLRKYVHLDEGDVCSSCSLRTSCNRAYLLTQKEDEARTLDVIRVLLTFGFDPINGSVENKPLMKMRSVKIKTVVRKLLYEIVKLSSVPIDPNLPPPIVKKPPPKLKQPPPPPKKRVGRDDIEMKKGDWLCPKCDFMNFAKNTVCLQCDAKRPKRQLLPGEWECPDCNFLNYRRNMVCFHCEHKRPPDEYMENQVQEKQSGHGTRLQRLARNPGVSDAWNFDFDDNESDGADVAAFEFADSPKADGVHSMGNQAYGDGKMRGFDDEDSFMSGRAQGVEEGDRYSEPHRRWSLPSVATRTGFDDFNDEDDDDIDSYELDTSNNNQAKSESTWSESDAFHHQTASSHFMRGKSPISNSQDSDSDLDSDGELSNHSSNKSSHTASRKHTSVRGHGRHMGLSSGSDDDIGISSDSDDTMERGFAHRCDEGYRHRPIRNHRKGVPDSEDEVSFGSDSESESALRSRGSRTNVRKSQSNFRGDSSSASAGNNGRFRLNGSQSNGRFRLNGSQSNGRFRLDDTREKHINSYGNRNNRNRGAVGSHRNEGVHRERRDWGQRTNERTGDFRSSDRPLGRDRIGSRHRESFDKFSGRRERESISVDERPHRRRIIER